MVIKKYYRTDCGIMMINGVPQVSTGQTQQQNSELLMFLISMMSHSRVSLLKLLKSLFKTIKSGWIWEQGRIYLN